MPTLADIYSTIGSLKRKGSDFIQNPVLGAQQMVGNANDQARALNQLTAESAQEGLSYGPKTQQLGAKLGEAYNPVGIFTPADTKLAFKAAQLERKGVNEKEIFNRLNVFRGPTDKQWRQEISDKVAQIKGGPDFQTAVFDQMKKLGKDKTAEAMRVEDLIHHPELFAKHPELKNIEVQFLPEKHPAYGRMGFAEDDNHFLQIKGSLQSEDAIKTALHELQHVIQESSGHAVGGSSVDFMKQDAATKARDILHWRREVEAQAERMGMTPSNNSDWYRNAEQAVVDQYHKMKAHEWLPHEEIRNQASWPMYSKGTDSRTNAEQLMKMYGLDNKTSPYTPFQMYNRLGGEAEARQVMSRKSLTDQERQQYFPAEERNPVTNPYGYDLPLKDLLYLSREGYPK
jgi:hypothetical protein